MPKIKFASIKLRASSLAVIAQANVIINEFAAMGFTLTLRQLYYQFVSRDWIPNQQREYKRLGSIVNDGRLAGLIDWDAIEDRGRNLQRLSSWDSPSSIVRACADQFRYDLWEDQEHYVEVWIEKEALIGVVAVPCDEWRVPHFACKGYTSQSEMWDAGYNRLRRQAGRGKEITILHLGDHDPSGIDMTRDIRDRLEMFVRRPVEIVRLALNMNQVEEYDPPPNPAKTTDSRFEGYMQEFGEESWELDALSPNVIAELITGEIEERLDRAAWDAALEREEEAKASLSAVADRFEDVAEFLRDTETGGA